MKVESRESVYPIHKELLARISYRTFGAEPLLEQERMALFEAARWAPSSYNNQSWRFVYVCRNDPEWKEFFEALVEFNKSWCARADTLAVLISKDTFDHNEKPSRTAPFDTGAAWMSLAVEASSRGLIAHAMEGFRRKYISDYLRLPEGYTVQVMIAIGRRGDVSGEEVSQRKPLSSVVCRGKWSFDE